MSHFDFAIIGSGPAGQKAAIQAAKAGCSVAMVERDRLVGGGCVHRGTIPSKTLRATALELRRASPGDLSAAKMPADTEVATLMSRLEQVTSGHAEFMRAQLLRNKIEILTGRARFIGPNELCISQVRGPSLSLTADFIVVATGSRPRQPPDIPIDHEHILDSDSILSMIYLPKSLTVLGAGVIASEYASIFATLGTKVTIIDRGNAPVGFMDSELSTSFVEAFEASGGRYVPSSEIKSCAWDGEAAVVTELTSGEVVRSDKLLCALGRLANVDGLGLETIGVEQTKRGHIQVDENYRSSIPSIYGAGDVIGAPALASTSMEQGRAAVRHALQLPRSSAARFIPVGIYTIPEMSSVGLTEEQACEQYGGCTVGRASFSEVARGHISDSSHGLLKLVADPRGDKLLGAHIIGSGACELVHIAQVALLSSWSIEAFVENIFNFPTLAEAYRIAALNLINQGSSECEEEAAS